MFSLCLQRSKLPLWLLLLLAPFTALWESLSIITNGAAFRKSSLEFIFLPQQSQLHPNRGNDFIRPLIITEESKLFGTEQVDSIVNLVKRKENVVILANHQTEADPQVLSSFVLLFTNVAIQSACNMKMTALFMCFSVLYFQQLGLVDFAGTTRPRCLSGKYYLPGRAQSHDWSLRHTIRQGKTYNMLFVTL